MNEDQFTKKQGLLSYRDVRNQLIRRLRIGCNYPIAEVEIATKEIGVFPNTETILYSTVSNGTKEEIYIHQPQENTTYELVELNPSEGEDLVTEEGRAVSLPDQNSADQPRLILKTPEIGNFERTFSIRATTNQVGLVRYLDKIVKVQAGINKELEVTSDKQTISFEDTVTIIIQNGQADCEYVLALEATETGENREVLSISDYSIEARTVVLKSFPLRENTIVSVYAVFRTSGIDGYLNQKVSIDVLPNTFLNVELLTPELDYCTEELVSNGQVPVTGKIKLSNTQASATYQAFFTWVDPTIPPIPFPYPVNDVPHEFSDADWGISQEKASDASEVYPGTGTESLTISLNKYLPEDVIVRVEATNTVSGKKVNLQTKVLDEEGGFLENADRLIRFKVIPSPHPLLEAESETISAGEKALIKVVNAQVGGYYQLYDAENDQPVGAPQFMAKKRPIGIAEIEVDLTVDPNEQEQKITLELETPPLSKETQFYVKVIKPINTPLEDMNEKGLRLSDEITIKIAQ